MRKLNVKVEIINTPEGEFKNGFIVVRQVTSANSAELWYYGFYNDKNRAISAAVDIGNGAILEV